MPTIHREAGFRFFFYTREGNEPPHIHVVGKGGEIKLWLDPVAIAKSYNLTSSNQKRILEITMKNPKTFLEKWGEYHDTNS